MTNQEGDHGEAGDDPKTGTETDAADAPVHGDPANEHPGVGGIFAGAGSGEPRRRAVRAGGAAGRGGGAVAADAVAGRPGQPEPAVRRGGAGGAGSAGPDRDGRRAGGHPSAPPVPAAGAQPGPHPGAPGSPIFGGLPGRGRVSPGEGGKPGPGGRTARRGAGGGAEPAPDAGPGGRGRA